MHHGKVLRDHRQALCPNRRKSRHGLGIKVCFSWLGVLCVPPPRDSLQEELLMFFLLSQALENEGKSRYKGGHLVWGTLLGVYTNKTLTCCAQSLDAHLFQIPDKLWKEHHRSSLSGRP